MGTMRIEKKTTRGYIKGVLRFIELIVLEFGCFTGIESESPLHATIKGFP